MVSSALCRRISTGASFEGSEMPWTDWNRPNRLHPRPFWLSPRQAIVVPVAAPHKAYAQEVMQTLWDAGIYSEVDLSDVTLNKKIVSSDWKDSASRRCTSKLYPLMRTFQTSPSLPFSLPAKR